MALTDGLESFWELEEASGTRSDSHGSNDLTDNNTVTQTTGKVGNCAQFTAASSESLSHADNASLSVGGDTDFTFCAWVRMDSKPGTSMDIVSQWESANLAHNLFWYQPEDRFIFGMSNDGTNAVLCRAVTNGTNPSLSTWYFIVAWNNSTADTASIQIGNGTLGTLGTIDSITAAGGAFDSTEIFRIGAQANTPTGFWDGRIDQVGFWKRLLTTDEITYLFNAGAGRSYAEISTPAGPNLPAEPAIYYDTTYVAPTPTTIHTPANAGAFQTALTNAVAGDEIRLTAGVTYSGNFTLPVKTGSSYIHIRSTAALTTEGVRITTAQAAGFPKIVTGNAGAAIQADPGAFYYRIINCEITSGSTAVNGYTVGLGTGAEVSPTPNFPHHIIIDRCYVHGHTTSGGRRGVMFAGSYQAVIDSYVSDYKEVGNDTQAVAGWTGYGPYKIVNNYLEASGENIMFGGSDTGVTDLTPSDIEIRNNHLFKPFTWKIGHPSYLGVAWTIKNILELKHCQRVMIENNILENCWSHAQAGNALVLTVRNQGSFNPWAVVQDITFRNNEIHHAEIGVTATGNDEYQTALQASRFLIEDNYYHHMTVGEVYLLNGTLDMTINHDTADHDGSVALFFFNITEDNVNFRLTNNIFRTNTYGIYGDTIGSGNTALAEYAPGAVVQRNIMIGADALYYPLDNFYPANVAAVGFVNYPTDLRLSPSSTYHNQGTDGTDPGAIMGVPVTIFKPAFAAGVNQMIT